MPAPGVLNRRTASAAPVAPIEPYAIVEHGETRVDPYRWMHRLDDPRVTRFLAENNAHAERAIRHTEALQAQLLDELTRLTPANEGAAAYRVGDNWYRLRFSPGADYPCFTRRRGAPDAPEEILLDGNALAAGHACFVIEGIQVSPDHARLAFAVDTSGDRAFTLHFKDLVTGRMLPDRIDGADSWCAWANDSRTLFYAGVDPVTMRPCRFQRHVLCDDPVRDAVVYEESDPAFRCLVTKTRSTRYVLLTSFSDSAEETRLVDADDPGAPCVLFCPRSAGHEYELDHADGHFVVRTNLDAPDFRVCAVPVGASSPDAWEELVPRRDGTIIERVAAFREHLALVLHEDGLQRLRIIDRRNGEAHEPRLPDPVYHVWIDANPDVNATVLRIGYTSLVTPASFYDYDMRSRRLTLLEREDAPGYVREDFATQRLRAPARDGARVPVTLVYRRDVRAAGPAPLLLFGYGAYGTNMPIYFVQSRLALLQRGFIFGMAHVRGGSELGRAWYNSGRLLNKINTFTDFIDCAEFLAESGIARRDRMFAESLSAGGLMLGAVMNMRPDLFCGVIANVSFVDLLNSMSDPLNPYTCFEYDEWGDPRRPAHWTYMRSYSPYENIRRQPYPNLLATAAMNDSQVSCREPAKWVAALRVHNTAESRILLRTHMESGHGGTSGRIRQLRDIAFAYAFLLDLAGDGKC